MTPKPTALAAAVAAALGTVAAVPASALTVTTAAQTFTVSGSVTDLETAGSTSTTLSSTPTIGEFDSTLGVLTGATINVTSTRTQTVSVAATGSGKSTTSLTTSGSGSSTASISAEGVTGTFTSIAPATATCTGKDSQGCKGSVSSADVVTNGTFAVAGASLNSYVGTGSETITFSSTVTATQGTGTFTGAETTTTGLKWNTSGKGGEVSATYDYLLHADPSFDASSKVMTLDLDFGTLYLGEDAAEKTFSIFNPAGERVGLDLDSFAPTGDSGAFTTDLALFSGLAAGGSNGFWFDFVTSTLGAFSASYALNFSDADVGAASSRFSFIGYRINLTGNVIARPVAGPAPVPAPGVLGLLGGGLMALGLARRRRSG